MPLKRSSKSASQTTATTGIRTWTSGLRRVRKRVIFMIVTDEVEDVFGVITAGHRS